MHAKKSLKGVWDPKFSVCSIVFSNEPMNFLFTKVHLIIARNEWIINFSIYKQTW